MIRHLFLSILVILFVVTVSTAQSVDEANRAFTFDDVSKAAGIAGTGVEGNRGVAFADFDNDGDLDIYITNSPVDEFTPSANFLFVNQGDGTFLERAEEFGVAGLKDFGAFAVLFADMNVDGIYDLILSNWGTDSLPGQNRLFWYFTKRDIFLDRTKRTSNNKKKWRTQGIVAGDFNNDGYPDFIVSNPIGDAASPPSRSYSLNRTMESRKGRRYFRYEDYLDYTGFTRGIIAGDVDNDGDLDLIESLVPQLNVNDSTNTLWLNNGSGEFTDHSDALGLHFYRDGQRQYNSSSLADIDNDGDLDLLTVSSSGVRLFENRGDMNWAEVTAESGLSSSPGGNGAAFGDINNDGQVDLIVNEFTNGTVIYKNIGNNNFRKISNSGVSSVAGADPQGIALGDYDDDGDLDILAVFSNAPAQLLRNRVNNPKFLKVRLTSPFGEVGAIGTKVYVYRSGEGMKENSLLFYREVSSSNGYMSQNSPEVHVGLRSKNKTLDIKVVFLNGSSVKLTGVEPGRTVDVSFQP